MVNLAKTLSVQATHENLPEVMAFVAAVASDAGLDKRKANQLRLAVEEIATNIIKYSYTGGEAEGLIKLDAELDDTNVTILIEDSGPPFDPTAHTPADTNQTPGEEWAMGGKGLDLVMKSMDAFAYQRIGNHNRNVVTVKRDVATANSETENPMDELAREFAESQERVEASTGRLAKVLERTLSALEASKVELSVDISGLMETVSSDLERAQNASSAVMSQLSQSRELVRTSALMTSSLELQAVLEEVMDTIIALTGAERGYIMLHEKDSDELKIHAARNWDRESLDAGDVAFSEGIARLALEQAEPIMSTNAQADDRFKEMKSVFKHDLRSILCVPLIQKGETVGILYADNRIEQGAFHDEMLAVLIAFANQAAIAIENARLFERAQAESRLERELQIGREIQAGFLPEVMPKVRGWEIAAFFEPARQVAGDFYDTFMIGRNRVGVVIADVTDKGVGAALFMALFRSLLRAFAQQNYSSSALDVLVGDRPSTMSDTGVVDRRAAMTAGSAALQNAILLTNNYIATNHGDSNMFATVFFGILNPVGGALTYINAGHNPPMLVSPEGEIKAMLEPTGPAVGLLPDMEFKMEQMVFEVGDLLVSFTDGLPEAKNPNGEFYTEERLISFMKEAGGSAAEIVKRIEDDVRGHIADADQFDDLTMLVVRRVPKEKKE